MDQQSARRAAISFIPGQRAAFIVAIVLTVAAVGATIATWQDWQDGSARDDAAGRQQVVEMIERGEIPLGTDVHLPASLSGLTANDWVCSYRDADGLTVGFPMRLGLNGWEGYVYQSEGRLTPGAGDPCGSELGEVTAVGNNWFRVSAG